MPAKRRRSPLGANNSPPGRIEQWYPITGGNQYMEGGFGEVWRQIGTHTPFPNTTRAAERIDNGAGISWNFNVAPGGNRYRACRLQARDGWRRHDTARLVVDLADELIANFGNRLDEPGTVSVVAQRFTDFPNPLGQGVLDDVHARPDSLEQFILGEDPASVLEEMQQELECLRRKVDVHV